VVLLLVAIAQQRQLAFCPAEVTLDAALGPFAVGMCGSAVAYNIGDYFKYLGEGSYYGLSRPRT
jgi:hypothetical protein